MAALVCFLLMAFTTMTAPLSSNPAQGASEQVISRCGTTDVPAHLRTPGLASPANPFHKHTLTQNSSVLLVDVYIHIVYRAHARVPNDTMISDQVAVLSRYYNPAAIAFNHVNTSYTNDTKWATGRFDDEMKLVLRRGGYQDLNLYFLSGDLGCGLTCSDSERDRYIGVCCFPRSVNNTEREVSDSGCDIAIETMPGAGAGDCLNFAMGATAVHEVGHWFGLLHPFEGGCLDGFGDGITDTPSQADATSGCPTAQDSCLDQEGMDGIHNFMDYSDDSWYV